jgi:hypothetical protein
MLILARMGVHVSSVQYALICYDLQLILARMPKTSLLCQLPPG